MKRKAFNFYNSYYEVAKELPEGEREKFLMALLQRQFEGIEPEGLTGFSKLAYVSQKHSIDSQVKGWEDKTGEKLTPTQPPSAPPSVGGTEAPIQPPSIQEKGKGEGKEKEQGKEELLLKKETKKFSFKEALIDYGFDSDLVEDWLKVRKTKKATNSQTAFNIFIKEVEKMEGVDLNKLLEFLIEKDWKGFKWEWIKKEKDSGQKEKSKVQDLYEKGQRVEEMLNQIKFEDED